MLSENFGSQNYNPQSEFEFGFVDWESLFMLPKTCFSYYAFMYVYLI